MSLSRFSPSIIAVSALSLVVWSAAPAFAQHRGGGGGSHGGSSRSGGGWSHGGPRSTGGGGGGAAVARSAPSGQRAAAPSTRAYGTRTAPMYGGAGPGRANGTYGYRYAAPRGGVAYGVGHYGGAYYSSGRYYGGYGYRYVAPVHYLTPYYHFRPWYSVGFGISIGYPVPWPYPYYYYPAYYPYPYTAAPYETPSSTTYSNDGMYPATSSAYPSQDPTGTNGSASVQTPSQQDSGGISLEITPADAELFVDGARIGTVGQFTPQSQPLGLSVGRHRLEIRAPGYQPLNIDADIVSGQVIPYQGAMRRQ